MFPKSVFDAYVVWVVAWQKKSVSFLKQKKKIYNQGDGMHPGMGELII